jgi:hypothetical protein
MKKRGIGKGKKLRATIYPLSGSPFEQDLVTDEKSCVEVDGKMWLIVAGSTWKSNGHTRVVLPEAHSESLTSDSIIGRFWINARVFFGYMKMNLLEQLNRLQNQKPWYGQASVWIIAGAIGLLILVGFIALNGISSSIEELGEAIKGLNFPSGDNQGHQELKEGK